MRKSTIFVLVVLIIAQFVCTKAARAVTVDEIRNLIASYPDSYFTNANAGIKDSFFKSLETIASNINLLDTETDTLFKSELGQELYKGIETLISNTDGCVSAESNSPDTGDWLSDCQAQNIIYSKLNELLTIY